MINMDVTLGGRDQIFVDIIHIVSEDPDSTDPPIKP
jgi:hypothetical protein